MYTYEFCGTYIAPILRYLPVGMVVGLVCVALIFVVWVIFRAKRRWIRIGATVIGLVIPCFFFATLEVFLWGQRVGWMERELVGSSVKALSLVRTLKVLEAYGEGRSIDPIERQAVVRCLRNELDRILFVNAEFKRNRLNLNNVLVSSMWPGIEVGYGRDMAEVFAYRLPTKVVTSEQSTNKPSGAKPLER